MEISPYKHYPIRRYLVVYTEHINNEFVRLVLLNMHGKISEITEIYEKILDKSTWVIF